MQEWDALLQLFSDDPSEFEREGGTALFTRHGQECIITVKDIAGIGLAVESRTGGWTPLATYVQRELLELPRLASQICRTLDKFQTRRPVPFVDGPAELTSGVRTLSWPKASTGLASFLLESEPGTTRIIQLMAGAGRGKTILLESTAIQFAQSYQPDPNPRPLLLPVDLLGRYVGTIDDAIAGSLNNTYLFPRLSQRDIVAGLRCGWIILALDGFDELVARVGVRDAFYRISDLLDQLGSSGTLILSARESFFELYSITAGIRTYLQPRSASYTTAVLKLSPWSEVQGRTVFSKLGSTDPARELDALSAIFENDAEVVLHPFFLTRLAELWQKGERFEQASGQPDRHARMRYVIETYVARESGEKWIDRDQNPLLDTQGHSEMLGAVAEEMWRTGAFTLDAQELRIAAEIGLSDSGMPHSTLSQVLERLPTHAAFQPKARGFAFLHDSFLYYFLAYRLEKLLRQRDERIVSILSSQELPPEVLGWLVWRFKAIPDAVLPELVAFVNRMREQKAEGLALDNLALAAVRILESSNLARGSRFVGFTFVGDAFRGGSFEGLEFRECRFWQVDFSESRFMDCLFEKCQFGDVRVDGSTHLERSLFLESTFSSIEMVGVITRYAPDEIVSQLTDLGADIPVTTPKGPLKVNPVSEDFVRCLELLVRASEKTCDVAVDEICTDAKIGAFIERTGTDTGVLRPVKKQVSGPKHRFVRISVDREKLLHGQIEPTGNASIDNFWQEARRRYPRR
jgi:hypothetical protein